MCEVLGWLFDSKLTDWVSALGAVISGYIAFKVYHLDKRVSDEGKARVSVWFDNSLETFDGVLGELTFINLGKESLPVRKITFLFGNPEKRVNSIITNDIQGSVQNFGSIHYSDSQENLIFEHNKIVKLLLSSKDEWPTQFKIRAMYYDNTFEFINVDTSNLGGKYFLTGKGRK